MTREDVDSYPFGVPMREVCYPFARTPGLLQQARGASNNLSQ